jgi:hypothetical protein
VREQEHFGLYPSWLWASLAILVELGGSALVVSGYALVSPIRAVSQVPRQVRTAATHCGLWSVLLATLHYYTAQHAHPSAPQKDLRSETGNLLDHAMT